MAVCRGIVVTFGREIGRYFLDAFVKEASVFCVKTKPCLYRAGTVGWALFSPTLSLPLAEAGAYWAAVFYSVLAGTGVVVDLLDSSKRTPNFLTNFLSIYCVPNTIY